MFLLLRMIEKEKSCHQILFIEEISENKNNESNITYSLLVLI